MASLLAVSMIGSIRTGVFASESGGSTGEDFIMKTPISIVEEE